MNRIALSSVSVHLSIPLGSGERSISDKARPPPRGQAEDEVRYRVLYRGSKSRIRNPKSKIQNIPVFQKKKEETRPPIFERTRNQKFHAHSQNKCKLLWPAGFFSNCKNNERTPIYMCKSEAWTTVSMMKIIENHACGTSGMHIQLKFAPFFRFKTNDRYLCIVVIVIHPQRCTPKKEQGQQLL